MRRPRVVLDLGGLDELWPGAGLYRYVVDLVSALHTLSSPLEFVVFGSRQLPIPDLAHVFEPSKARIWSYRHVPMQRRFLADLRRQIRVSSAIAAVQPALYHCVHTFVPLPAPCPVVATIHDMMYELFSEYGDALKTRAYRLMKWGVRRRARRVITISHATATDLTRLWAVPPSRIDVVQCGLAAFGNGVVATTPKNPSLASLGEGPIVLSPLNLEPRKNLRVLLEAFARLPEQFKAARLVVYGKGGWSVEREQEYRKTVERLNLQGRLVEPGVISDSDLWWLYKRATLFVFPTLYEGFGYPALEAMAAGSCVVVRGISSMAEVVGDAGVKIEPFTSDSLVTTIAALLSDPDRRESLGKAAKKRAATFSAERMAQGTLDSYLKVIRGKLSRESRGR